MPTSEVIQQGQSAGQDAVTGLKGRIAPTSLLNGSATRPCAHGVQLRGTRLHTPLKRAQPARPDTSGGATPANMNSSNGISGRSSTSTDSQAGSGMHPMCQPMPVQMLVHLMDTLTTHRPPAQDSRAILTALNDYIGDVISQPGPAAAAESRNHFDPTSDFSALPAQPVVPPASNGVSNGVYAQPPSGSAAQKAAAAHDESFAGSPKPGGCAAESAALKRTAVAGATVTATTPEHPVNAAASSTFAAAHASTGTLQAHILRWSADLGILQALHANGYTETEVENFVNKLLPGLADGVTNQLSQAGYALPADNDASPSTSAPAAPLSAAAPVLSMGGVGAAAAAATSAPVAAPAAKARGAPPPQSPPPPPYAISAAAGEPYATAAESSSSSSSPHASEPAAVAPPRLLLTDKVSPFIQHPYHLLQQLHDSARKRVSSGDSPSGAMATAVGLPGEAGQDAAKAGAHIHTDIYPHTSQAVPAPSTPALNAPHAALTSEPEPAPQHVHVHGAAHVDAAMHSATATNIPEASETGESTSTRSTSEFLPAAHAQALATACSVGSSSAEGSAAGCAAAFSAGPIGWKSVLEKLIHAGPQAVQPVSPYVPGSHGWGSGNSSTEHDTFSAKSEDAPPADGGAGNTSSGSAGGNTSAASTATGSGSNGGTSKAKKRRNKRSKNSGRSGS